MRHWFGGFIHLCPRPISIHSFILHSYFLFGFFFLLLVEPDGKWREEEKVRGEMETIIRGINEMSCQDLMLRL